MIGEVRLGGEVVIVLDHEPVALLRPTSPRPRTISDCIALAEVREKERGHAIVLDPDFVEAVEEVVRNRQPWNPPAWD